MAFAMTVLRVAVLGVTWSALLVIGHWARIGLRTFAFEPPPSIMMGEILIGFVLILAGLALADRILRIRVSFGERRDAPAPPRKATAEPETLRLRDMIALLDEDDLADLRAEVREGLRDRIRNLTADESESFETLLSDAGAKRKR